MKARGLFALLIFGMLAAAAWEPVGETVVGCTDPAAGKFPSGKLLLASVGLAFPHSNSILPP